jgi:hypothetical protein
VDNFLGQIRLSQGHHDRAAQLFTDGLGVARGTPDRISILISLYDLALASQARGDLAGAAGHLNEGLGIAAEAGDETSAAYYLEALATVARLPDDPQGAVRLLAAARSLLETTGSGWPDAYVPRVRGPGVGRVHWSQERRGLRARASRPGLVTAPADSERHTASLT